MWEITSTKSEGAWFDDYVMQIISSAPAPRLPSHEGSLGSTDWFWYSPEPGHYWVQTGGGTLGDRLATQGYVESQLEAFGLQRMAVKWNATDREQVQGKALRLIRTNKVQVHDNMPNLLSGTVIGDHGTYQPEIQRDPTKNPRSQDSLISGHCDCDWGTFMNTPRTREYKQYQNAPCAHLVALWWLGQSMPLDTGEPNPTLQNGQGDMGQFEPNIHNPIMNFAPNMPGPNIPGLTPRPDSGTTDRAFGPGGGIGGGQGAGGEPNTSPGPEAALPQAQPEPIEVDPNGSVPGKKPPSPSNPIQYPGGTFSSIKESADMPFNEGDMVQLKNDDFGTGVGDAGYASVGQQLPIPAGTIGEVRGVHVPTGMVEVFYNEGPFLQNGPLQAHGASAWHFPNDLKARPDLRGGSPMIRRT